MWQKTFSKANLLREIQPHNDTREAQFQPEQC